jgi:hypothetical protein
MLPVLVEKKLHQLLKAPPAPSLVYYMVDLVSE